MTPFDYEVSSGKSSILGNELPVRYVSLQECGDNNRLKK